MLHFLKTKELSCLKLTSWLSLYDLPKWTLKISLCVCALVLCASDLYAQPLFSQLAPSFFKIEDMLSKKHQGDTRDRKTTHKGTHKGLVPTADNPLSLLSRWAKWLHNDRYDRLYLMKSLQTLAQKPHPFGSPRQKELSEWLVRELKKLGIFHLSQTFHYNTPDHDAFTSMLKLREKLVKKMVKRWGYNVVAKVIGSKDCSIILGSHYDSKELYDEGINLGANDSGSSSAALLEMARVLSSMAHHTEIAADGICDVYLVWFDGEESVLKNWDHGKQYYGIQDNTYGSRYMASTLKPPLKDDKAQNRKGYVFPASFDGKAKPIAAMIVVDMIGTKKLQLSDDQHSHQKLRLYRNRALQSLKLSHMLASRPTFIADDHIPFQKLGIPSLLLINFEDLTHWHTPQDTLDHVSVDSIIEAIKVALHVVLQISEKPVW
ncbi:MAG: M28 family metallopeptidase [Proteobacteria bacterium]|nr:M28 family metallopeptidase [Pseudomonadota bacterium]